MFCLKTAATPLQKMIHQIYNAIATLLKIKTLRVLFSVVFKTNRAAPRSYDWSAEYERVLNKIRRRLERNEANYDVAIPFDKFAYYEKDESSIKRITGSRKPHHFHALIPIRKANTYRFWSIDLNDLNLRLRKDIESIDTVQSIVVELIPNGKSIDWTKYILKAKSI